MIVLSLEFRGFVLRCNILGFWVRAGVGVGVGVGVWGWRLGYIHHSRSRVQYVVGFQIYIHTHTSNLAQSHFFPSNPAAPLLTTLRQRAANLTPATHAASAPPPRKPYLLPLSLPARGLTLHSHAARIQDPWPESPVSAAEGGEVAYERALESVVQRRDGTGNGTLIV